MPTQLTELQAKLSADSSKLLAELERAKQRTRELGREGKQAGTESAAGMSKMVTSADRAAKGVAGVLNGLYALEAKGSARVLALGNAIGSVAGLLGPQGKMVQGISIVGSAIVALLLQAKEKSAEASRAIEEDIKRLTNAGDLSAVDKQLGELFNGSIASGGADGIKSLTQRVALLKEEQAALASGAVAFKTYAERQKAVNDNREALEKDSRALELATKRFDLLKKSREQIVDRLSSTSGGRGGPRTIVSTADSIDEQAQKAAKLSEALAALQQRAQDLNEVFSQATPGQKAARDLQQLIDAYEKAGVPVRELQSRLAELQTVAFSNGGTPWGLAAEAAIAMLRKKYGSLVDVLADLTQKQEQFAGAEASAKLDKFVSGLEEMNQRDVESNQLLIKRLEARDDLADVSARAAADAEAELRALREGADAYDTFLRNQAQDVAARDVIARARAEGKQASAQEIIDARTTAALLYDSAALARQLQAALAETGAGKLAGELAAVAESATQIATSLGDAGVNIARVAAIAGPLFKGLSGLQQALVKRDADGKLLKGSSVGLLSALRGSNGKDSQASALSGTLSIIGAVATIADAIDLFGTRARQKAAEMREAAAQFAKALSEFAASANPQSGASEAIKQARKQAGDLLDQFLAAGRLKLGGARPTEITSDFLRTIAGAEKANGPLRELADTLDKLEAAAKEQVLRNTEDLNVRKLAAAGLTEEAAALRRRLDAEREIRAAEGDRTDEGQRYLALLRDTIAAEQAAAEAEIKRTAALELLDDTLSILGGTSGEQLQTTINTLKDLFPQFGELFDGLDLSTKEGLSAAKANLRELFTTISADGITEAERPIIEAIKRLLGGIESALGDLTDPLAAALEVFGVRVEVFGLNAQEQFDALAEIFRNAFPDIDALLSSTAGQSPEAIRQAIRDKIAAILEGGITDAERPLLEAYQRLLGSIGDVLDDAAQAAADAAAEAEAKRRDVVTTTDTRTNATIQLGGLTGADALRAKVRGGASLSPALAGIAGLFDDTSAAGIQKTKGALFDLFRQIDNGTLPAEQFGNLTKEEIIARIIELNGELDGLAGALDDAAKAAMAAAEAERQQTSDLRIRLARSKGTDTRLAEFDLAAQREREARLTEGRSAAFLNFLDQVLASERQKLIAEIAGEATSAAISEATAAAADKSATNGDTIGRGFTSLSEVTGQTLGGYLRDIAQNTRSGAQYSAQLVALLSGLRVNGSVPIPSLPIAAGSTAGLAGATIVINIGAPTVSSPTTGSPAELGAQIGRAQAAAIAAQLGRMFGEDVAYRGGRKR